MDTKYTTFKLKNGLKVLIYPVNHVNSVSIAATVRAGHFCEEKNQSGIAHLLEHMLFDGTEKFPTFKRLNAFFDQIAGEYGGTTSHDTITIAGTFVDEELENALIPLRQILFHPLLLNEFLEKEKGIVLDEIATYEESPSYQNYLKALQIRFKGETILSDPLGGKLETVRALTQSQVKSYHSKFFQPSNMQIIIAGKCSPNKTKKLLRKYFDLVKNKEEIKHKKFSQKQFSKQNILVTNNHSQKTYVRINFPSFSWEDKPIERITLSYLSSLLTNRRDSILYSKLREENGWIYDIDSNFYTGFNIGLFEISTSTPPKRGLDVIREILSSLEDVKNNPPNEKYLEKVKDIDRKRMKMVLDSPTGIIKWFSDELFYRRTKILLPKDVIELYKDVTPQKVQEIAKKILDYDKMNIIVTTPKTKITNKQYMQKIKNFINK